MPNVLYTKKDAVVTGDYLIGHYSWPTGAVLRGADIRYSAPTSMVVLGMEIDGIETKYSVQLLPGSYRTSWNPRMPVIVSANAVVRWKVTHGPATGSTTNLAMVMNVAAVTLPSVSDTLTVRFEDTAEAFDCWYYNPHAKVFTEASTGISTGKARIVDTAGQLRFYLHGTLGVETIAMVIGTDGNVYAASFTDSGFGTLSQYPRLVFKYGTLEVGRLTTAGFSFTGCNTADSVKWSESEFAFYANSVLQGMLGTGGLEAAGLNAVDPATVIT